MCWHKWNMWSEPKDWVWYKQGEKHEGRIQDRTCGKCGKYQWRPV